SNQPRMSLRQEVALFALHDAAVMFIFAAGTPPTKESTPTGPSLEPVWLSRPSGLPVTYGRTELLGAVSGMYVMNCRAGPLPELTLCAKSSPLAASTGCSSGTPRLLHWIRLRVNLPCHGCSRTGSNPELNWWLPLALP